MKRNPISDEPWSYDEAMDMRIRTQEDAERKFKPARPKPHPLTAAIVMHLRNYLSLLKLDWRFKEPHATHVDKTRMRDLETLIDRLRGQS